MIQRRDLILSVAGTAAIAAWPWNASRASMMPRPAQRTVVICDKRLERGVQFESLARGAHIRVAHVCPDAGLIPVLDPQLFAAEPLIIGMTGYSDYLLAAGLAREHRRAMRAALLQRHDGAGQILAGDMGMLRKTLADVGCPEALAPQSAAQAAVLWTID